MFRILTKINRQQYSEFTNNPRTVKQYEDLFLAVDAINAGTIAPGSANIPQNVGDMTFEATSNTVLTIRLMGTDGVVRSATLGLV
jgi:hypothetical protein